MYEPNPSGICRCGCGNPAPLARQTDTKLGYIAGKPVRYIRGHVGRTKVRDRLTEADYHIEDRGHATPCFIWNGVTNKRTGYCRVKFEGRYQLPHRVMHEQEIGPIPAGFDVDHLCSQRDCVRPEHLEAVTRRENIRRSRRTKLTPADVALIRSSTLTQREIAALVGISREHVRDIRSRKRWRED